MEKNQHSNHRQSEETSAQDVKGRPGQQLPSESLQPSTTEGSSDPSKEQHSESSFPTGNDETLGTP